MYFKNSNIQSRCYNFENMTSLTGNGGKENNGAKGHAFDILKAGEEKTLFCVEASGVIDHIWLTFKGTNGVLSPILLKGLLIEMFWDEAKTPAVSCPLADFFGLGLCRLKEFENELFSAPGAKALNSYIKMPFLKNAKITIKNETEVDVCNLFYTIEYHTDSSLTDILYFHAYYRRENPTAFKKDYEILPYIEGNGRFLGTSINVISNPAYSGTWWGEGEVKIYLDGDKDYPTIIGTGTEDYIGTGWGVSEYSHRYQGCHTASADQNSNGRWSFYRFHIPDPIYFHKNCRVTVQQIGGATKARLLELKNEGAEFEIVSVDRKQVGGFIKAYEAGIELCDDIIEPNDWCNFYRADDWFSTSYLYLDRPEGAFLMEYNIEERLAGISDEYGQKRGDIQE